MMLKLEDVLSLLKTLSGNYGRSKSLVILYLDAVGLYTVRTKELPFCNRVADNIIKIRAS